MIPRGSRTCSRKRKPRHCASRTAERQVLHPIEDDDEDEPAVVKAARDIEGVSATSGDTALEPLLNAPAARRPTWVYASGIGLLAFMLFVQLVHYNRQGLVLNASVGPLVSTVYGWFDATPDAALGPVRVYGEAARRGSRRQ